MSADRKSGRSLLEELDLPARDPVFTERLLEVFFSNGSFSAGEVLQTQRDLIADDERELGYGITQPSTTKSVGTDLTTLVGLGILTRAGDRFRLTSTGRGLLSSRLRVAQGCNH